MSIFSTAARRRGRAAPPARTCAINSTSRTSARECLPQGGQFAFKVGVSGRLLIGPAGSPGAYSSTLHVLVKRDIDDKVMFEKTYPISADTAGAAQVPYRLVTEPVLLPLTRARLDLDYSVYVGLGSGGRPAAVRHKRPRPNG